MSTVHWIQRSVLTVLLTGVGAAAQAQDMTPAPAPAGAAVLPVGVMAGDDYSLLSNRVYDYVDLKTALARGYSLGQIASIAKIARLTGFSFPFVLRQAETGRTFAWLAQDYNLRLGDVLDAGEEQAQIEEYLRLYESLRFLGQEPAYSAPAVAAVSGPTLSELEAEFSRLNAQFPALPPTEIETSPVVAETGPALLETLPVVVPPAPPPPVVIMSDPPVAPRPAKVLPHRARRKRVHKVRRHRHALPSYLMHRGS